MFPSLTIAGIVIPMTGLGILSFVCVFYFMTRKYAKELQIPFGRFAENFPMYIVATYIISSYTWYFFKFKRIIPLSMSDIFEYISPVGYEFHLVGIVFGLIASGIHFLKDIPDKHTQVKRIDSRFLATGVACIPLGIFLLLGDNFIGIESNTWYSISALTLESKLSTYGAVLPLGFLLSLTGLFTYLGTKFRRLHQPQLRGYGIRGFALFSLILCFLVLLQIYPKHGVIQFIGVTRDIKNYVLLGSSLWFARLGTTVYAHFSHLKS